MAGPNVGLEDALVAFLKLWCLLSLRVAMQHCRKGDYETVGDAKFGAGRRSVYRLLDPVWLAAPDHTENGGQLVAVLASCTRVRRLLLSARAHAQQLTVMTPIANTNKTRRIFS